MYAYLRDYTDTLTWPVIYCLIPGLIYDHFGSYTLALILMGGVQLLTVVALLVLVWLQRRRPASL